MDKQCLLFTALAKESKETKLTQKCMEQDQYIRQLEEVLRGHGLELPKAKKSEIYKAMKKIDSILMKEGNFEEFSAMIENISKLTRSMNLDVEFHDLTVSTETITEKKILTVSSIISSLFLFWDCPKKQNVNVLSKLTGRVLPKKLTLLIGPPGSGKSVFLQALGGRLHTPKNTELSGEVYYDGDNIKSRNFIVEKVSDYIEQGDNHEAVLSVFETLEFAWRCTTGGHHSYGRALDKEAASIINREDKTLSLIENIIMLLGLKSCKNTYVGNGMIRGVSGGQKRRVTVGELMVCPRPIKLMDCISNGLDTATTFDIVRSIRVGMNSFGGTVLMSLLQPPPDVYRLFDEVILMHEGHIIYNGPRESILAYFESIGYACPAQIDEADFLQELPTPDGKRFISRPDAPTTAEELAKSWKESDLYKEMMSEMKYMSLEEARSKEKHVNKLWYIENIEQFAGSFGFYFKLCLERQIKIAIRDSSFIRARVGQNLLVGAIAGSLFSNIEPTNVATMNGFLFNTMLFGALGSFAILPTIYQQKSIYMKHKDSKFYPTSAFTLAQTISMLPLQIFESVIYITIVYWSAGLSSDYQGSRFLTFIVLNLMFSMTISQLFRLIASTVPNPSAAMPISGIIIVIMVLFSGFIQPKSLISNGWIWFYWLNPIAWALKSVTINEFTSPKYDFGTCINPTCTAKMRFGSFVLEQYGNPTDEKYIWYSFAVLVAEYLFLFFLTFMCLKYYRVEVSHPAPVRSDVSTDVVIASNSPEGSSELPLEPIVFAFKDISYSVMIPNGEEVDLLKNVNGYFEPGSVTALMGTSGAGKTTLLDVLAGRKNSGIIKGEMYLNGVPKVDSYFRRIMGYVEQFDTLPQKSTAREAVEFSATLRLDCGVSPEQRKHWVNTVLEMMDLEPLENDLIGNMEAGGMTFEQRKRVSIAVELAANPSILFLDEPTTGLDSRAAQALIRNIRKIAASGRSIVCTIHQPSTAIFNSFDSLLLLRRGGQTVYFGELGENSQNLVKYFEAAPDVSPIPRNTNPATWMLDIIGAGTGASATSTDFHAFYNNSVLCEMNLEHLGTLTQPNEGSKKIEEFEIVPDGSYNSSFWTQFKCLFSRIALTYWRTPTYSLARHFTNLLIALIFGSAYPLQVYDNYVATASRSAVIYITSLFCGVLSMITIIPVMTAERPVFYREQQSRMYSVFIYALTQFLIEIPYLIVASLSFTLPFFFIVGFNNVGDVTEKFFWYWFFNFLLQATMLYLGQFYVSLTPNESVTQVLGGLTNTVLGLFCGYLIGEQSFPTFWLFMYWINPLHYALEGLISSQFHGDTTIITTMDGSKTTAENYISHTLFSKWSYSHIGFDVLALSFFISLSVIGNYLCLAYLRHDKR